MKQNPSFFSLALSIVLSASFLGGCSSKEAPLKQEGKILLVSDLHYYSDSLTDYGSKFQEIVRNADGKDPFHQKALLRALKDQIEKEKYDAVVFNGDIAFNGEEASFNDLTGYFDSVEESGTEVYVLPGNHDVGFYQGFSSFGDKTEEVKTYTPSEFRKSLGKYGYDSALLKDEDSFSYLVPLYQGLYGLFLDANSSTENVYEDSTAAFAKEALEYVKEKGGKAISFTHQPLLSHLKSERLDSRTVRSDEMLSLFKEYGVKVNFAGHLHALNRKESGGVSEIVNPCLSLLNNQYGVISYTEGKDLSYGCFSLDITDYVSSLEGYSSFKEYSEARYKRIQKEKILEAKDSFATETDEEELSLLGDYFAKINTDFFEGNLVKVDSEDPGFLAWESQIDSFWRDYVGKILMDLRLETDYHHFSKSL